MHDIRAFCRDGSINTVFTQILLPYYVVPGGGRRAGEMCYTGRDILYVRLHCIYKELNN